MVTPEEIADSEVQVVPALLLPPVLVFKSSPGLVTVVGVKVPVPILKSKKKKACPAPCAPTTTSMAETVLNANRMRVDCSVTVGMLVLMLDKNLVSREVLL